MTVFVKTMKLSNPYVKKTVRKKPNLFSPSAGRVQMKNYLQGLFNPIHPEKYKGNIKEIVFRSSWERGFMAFCDNTSEILAWSSEELIIPYKSPYDVEPGKRRRYYIDFVMWVKTKEGVKKYIIEIKPYNQTIQPILKRNGNSTRHKQRMKVYEINRAKWAAAREYAANNNCNFLLLTERDLYPKSVVLNESKNTYQKYKEKGVKEYWPRYAARKKAESQAK